MNRPTTTRLPSQRGVPKKWARPQSKDRALGLRVLAKLSASSATAFLEQHLQKDREDREDEFVRRQILQKLQSYQQQDEHESKRLKVLAVRQESMYSQVLHSREAYKSIMQHIFLKTNSLCFYCSRPVSILYGR